MARRNFKVDMDAHHRALVEAYLGMLDQAIADLESGGDDDFREALTLGINRLNLKSSDIAAGILVSKGAVSKWQSGHAKPNQPTRKATYVWLRDRSKEELSPL